MRGSSELISTIILVAAVLGMSAALWIYAQSSTSNLRNQQQIQSMISESSTQLNLLKISADPSQEYFIYQVTYKSNSTIYALILGVKGSSFLYSTQDTIRIPYLGNPYINISDSAQWVLPPLVRVPSSSIMIQPIYSSDSSYYSLDLWLGNSNIGLFKIDFQSAPFTLINVSPSSQYQEVLVFLIQIENKYWAFAYYYL
ncbi:MAG: hypothetical protein QW039_06485 [Fervidicoccaceae archaeon]